MGETRGLFLIQIHLIKRYEGTFIRRYNKIFAYYEGTSYLLARTNEGALEGTLFVQGRLRTNNNDEGNTYYTEIIFRI